MHTRNAVAELKTELEKVTKAVNDAKAKVSEDDKFIPGEILHNIFSESKPCHYLLIDSLLDTYCKCYEDEESISELFKIGLLLNSAFIIQSIYKQKPRFINALVDDSSESPDKDKILFLLYVGLDEGNDKSNRKNKLLDNPELFTEDFFECLINVWCGSNLYDHQKETNLKQTNDFLSLCKDEFEQRAPNISQDKLDHWKVFLKYPGVKGCYADNHNQCDNKLLDLQEAIYKKVASTFDKDKDTQSIDIDGYLFNFLQSTKGEKEANKILEEFKDSNQCALSPRTIEELLDSNHLNAGNISAVAIDSLKKFLQENTNTKHKLLNILFFQSHDVLSLLFNANNEDLFTLLESDYLGHVPIYFNQVINANVNDYLKEKIIEILIDTKAGTIPEKYSCYTSALKYLNSEGNLYDNLLQAAKQEHNRLKELNLEGEEKEAREGFGVFLDRSGSPSTKELPSHKDQNRDADEHKCYQSSRAKLSFGGFCIGIAASCATTIALIAKKLLQGFSIGGKIGFAFGILSFIGIVTLVGTAIASIPKVSNYLEGVDSQQNITVAQMYNPN